MWDGLMRWMPYAVGGNRDVWLMGCTTTGWATSVGCWGATGGSPRTTPPAAPSPPSLLLRPHPNQRFRFSVLLFLIVLCCCHAVHRCHVEEAGLCEPAHLLLVLLRPLIGRRRSMTHTQSPDTHTGPLVGQRHAVLARVGDGGRVRRQ